jgi:hypothetical protein
LLLPVAGGCRERVVVCCGPHTRRPLWLRAGSPLAVIHPLALGGLPDSMIVSTKGFQSICPDRAADPASANEHPYCTTYPTHPSGYFASITMSGINAATTVSSIMPTKCALHSVDDNRSSSSPAPPGATICLSASAHQLGCGQRMNLLTWNHAVNPRL